MSHSFLLFSLKITIIIICISSVLITQSSANNDDQLISAVAVFRHGDRAPAYTYPYNPYKPELYFPEGVGQLTNKGVERVYKLGQWFRNRYQYHHKNFLATQYNPHEIYVRSTDVDRTLASAAGVLAGLYPPTPSETWNPALKWRPIPVHTVPHDQDATLLMHKKCPKYMQLLYRNARQAPDLVALQRATSPLFEYMTNHTGMLIHNLYNVFTLVDSFIVESQANLEYPEWVVSEKTLLTLINAFDFIIGSTTSTRDLARLKVGPFFDELIGFFDKSSLSTHNHHHNRQKLRLYSAHDATIVDIMQAMGLYRYERPIYASALLFELYLSNTSNRTYVKMFFKNSNYQSMELQRIRPYGCSNHCDLDLFKRVLEPITVDLVNWEIECNQL